MRTGSYRRRGFTLIELLVVVAIVIILSALLLPALGKVRKRAKVVKARQEIGQIEAALLGYLREYSRPFGNVAGYGNWPADSSQVETVINGIQLEEPIVRMLAGANVDNANPMQLPFLSGIPASLDAAGRFVDPWENPYKFMFDYNDDGTLTIEFTDFDGKANLLGRGIAVWSRGPDGSDKESDNGWEDDIRSW